MSIAKRRRIFVCAEGEGERSLALWLNRLSDEQGRHLHLDIAVAGGGDTRQVVDFAVEQRKGRDFGALVFVDSDRLEEDRDKGRDPDKVEGKRQYSAGFSQAKSGRTVPSTTSRLRNFKPYGKRSGKAPEKSLAGIQEAVPRLHFDAAVRPGCLAARI